MIFSQTVWRISKPWVSNLRASDQLCPDRAIMQPEVTFLKRVYTTKCIQQFRQLVAPLIVGTAQATREPDVALSRKWFGGPQHSLVFASRCDLTRIFIQYFLWKDCAPSPPLAGLLASFTFQIAHVQYKYFIGSLEYVRRTPICLLHPQMYVDSVSENWIVKYFAMKVRGTSRTRNADTSLLRNRLPYVLNV